jgi:hypothetical protein
MDASNLIAIGNGRKGGKIRAQPWLGKLPVKDTAITLAPIMPNSILQIL